jgi:hypothetical protein
VTDNDSWTKKRGKGDRSKKADIGQSPSLITSAKKTVDEVRHTHKKRLYEKYKG